MKYFIKYPVTEGKEEMKKGIMICAGIVGILTTCEQTEIREITEPQGDSYDMEVIGDSLYASVFRSGIVYTWNISDIETQKDNTQTSVTTPTGVKIRSVAKEKDGSSLFVVMEKDGKMQFAEIALSDFQSRNFDRPLRLFTADRHVAFPSQPIIAYLNKRLILTNGDELERWEIRNNPSYVIRPGGKRMLKHH